MSSMSWRDLSQDDHSLWEGWHLQVSLTTLSKFIYAKMKPRGFYASSCGKIPRVSRRVIEIRGYFDQGGGL